MWTRWGLAAGGTGVLLVYAGRRLLDRQAAIAGRVIGQPFDDPPDADKRHRKRYRKHGKTIELLVLGDSVAAPYQCRRS